MSSTIDMKAWMTHVMDCLYPVGCYFETSDTTFDPNVTFGGTWVLETEGNVHVSAGTNYTVNGATQADGAGAKDGGSTGVPYHNHSVNEFNTGGMSANASHSHDAGDGNAFIRYNYDTVKQGVGERVVPTGGSGNYKAPIVNHASVDWMYFSSVSSTSVAHTHKVGAHNTNYAGTSGNNNMPPYINVYRWHRTA